MIAKVIVQIGISVALGSVLFVAAGTMQWAAAWVLIAQTGVWCNCTRLVAQTT